MQKITLLMFFVLASIASYCQPQITNYSFEDWSSRYGKVAPTGWTCDSIGLVNGCIKKVTGGSQGSNSIQLGTVTYKTEVISGLIQRVDSVTSTPGALVFDYKVVNNVTSQYNGLYIEIYFKDAKKKDLRDFNWTSSGNNTTFSQGTMPISFNTGEIPKYYTLNISYFNIGGIAGEFAIVDNLKFSLPSGGINYFKNSKITAYPNPANTILNFTDQPGDKLYKARLISIDGKISEIVVDNSSIDISTLNKGIYMLELYDTSNLLIKREKLSVVR